MQRTDFDPEYAASTEGLVCCLLNWALSSRLRHRGDEAKTERSLSFLQCVAELVAPKAPVYIAVRSGDDGILEIEWRPDSLAFSTDSRCFRGLVSAMAGESRIADVLMSLAFFARRPSKCSFSGEARRLFVFLVKMIAAEVDYSRLSDEYFSASGHEAMEVL